MCGICGFILFKEPNFESDIIIRNMTRCMTHRGPDDEGYFKAPPVFLGHRRLEIIDLESGQQPMTNEDGGVVVVFNGEIYNFQTLREQLLEAGHRLKTKSDSEVLVHLWEDRGTELPSYLNGMFAFAIYDQKARSLFLARDRMGQKPLYYTHTPSGFAFASELTALMKNPLVARQLDPTSVRQYLLYDSVPAPNTILKGVCKLEPGCSVLLEGGQINRSRYWDIVFPEQHAPKPDFEEAKREFQELMGASVRRRLISDVPLGVFLSGGIDSSTITAFMTDILPSSQVETFCIGFQDKSFDESSFSSSVARRFGTRHHEEILDAQTMLNLIPDIVARLDEPFADGSLIPTFLLSRFARQRVTVALGGDGGDELCLGYPTFQAHKIARWYARLPAILKNIISALVPHIPVSTANISFDFKTKRFVGGMKYAPLARHFVWIGGIPPHEQTELLTPEFNTDEPNSVFDIVGAHLARCQPRDDFDALTYLYSKLYMGDDILTKVDRASMMNSLEVRAPMLDPAVVEYFVSLPTEYKLKGLNLKYLLKQAMAPKLGREVVDRKKKGFGVPIAAWLKGPLRSWAESLISEGAIKKWGLFNPGKVRQLWYDHLNGRCDNRKSLWSIAVIQLWMEENI